MSLGHWTPVKSCCYPTQLTRLPFVRIGLSRRVQPIMVRPSFQQWQLWCSTYGIPPFMIHSSTVRFISDRSVVMRLSTGTCRTRPSTFQPSSVRLAIDPSAAKRLRSSTHGTLALISGSGNPFGCLFRSFPTLVYDAALSPATSYQFARA